MPGLIRKYVALFGLLLFTLTLAGRGDKRSFPVAAPTGISVLLVPGQHERQEAVWLRTECYKMCCKISRRGKGRYQPGGIHFNVQYDHPPLALRHYKVWKDRLHPSDTDDLFCLPHPLRGPPSGYRC